MSRVLTAAVRANTRRAGPSGAAGSADTSREQDAIRRSGLFDSVWYAERTPEAASFPEPLLHYLAVGARSGAAPHPLFDVAWYLKSAPDAATSGLTPLGHFVLRGEAAGLTVSPLFDPEWYRQQDPSIGARREGLFLHFLQHGAARGLSPHPAFDPAYYRASRADIAGSLTNPLTHYLEIGAREGVSPNAFFDVTWYAANVPELAASGMNPLVHFLTEGAAQGRQPHPDIDLLAYHAAHPDSPSDPVGTYRYLLTHETEADFFTPAANSTLARRHAGLLRSGFFVPRIYLKLNDDLHLNEPAAFEHFIRRGLPEGRRFTDPATVGGLLARMAPDLDRTLAQDQAAAHLDQDGHRSRALADWFKAKSVRIGVFCSSEGNFYMRDIAALLVAGLCDLGIEACLRDENAPKDSFDLRLFVAPHEFFYLGKGRAWRGLAGSPGSVLYNVEQPQSPWFARALQVLVKAPLVLDINFQTAALLRRAGFAAVHFMPGYLAGSPATQPREDVSDIELARGYPFARERYDWRQRDALEDRPIDVLFVGATAPRRDKALTRLLDLTDEYRFLCIYRSTTAPLTDRNETATSTTINCALAQRSKIVLNIYRDWMGYFDWSRIVQYGFWQGAGVVTDPSMAHPIYQPGIHFQQESTRHLTELIRWLLGTPDGRRTLDQTRKAGFAQATGPGAMAVGLVPVLSAFKSLLSE